MMDKKWMVLVALAMGVLLASCTPAAQTTDEGTAGNGASQTADEGVAGDGLAQVASLLGQQDADTADLFGGGTENWTADKSVYIGRVFETKLYGEPVTIYTSCGQDDVVESVSVWIADGTGEVSDQQVGDWQMRVSEATGVQMEDMGQASESGTYAWRWQTNDTFYTLRLLENILSLDIVPAVGELQ